MTRSTPDPAAGSAPVSRRVLPQEGRPAASRPPLGAAGGNMSPAARPYLPPRAAGGSASESGPVPAGRSLPGPATEPAGPGSPAPATRAAHLDRASAPVRGRVQDPGRGALASSQATSARPAGTTYVRGGVTLTATARCLRGCDWATGPGTQAEVDKAAEKHTTRPPKHPTITCAELAGIRGTA